MTEFSYHSTLFVNLQISMVLLLVGNPFSISTQKEVSLQKSHKNTGLGHPHQNQLSMILYILFGQEQDMDAVFSQEWILQLIGLSLRKIITLPTMPPSANGSNKLIETLKNKSKRNGWLTCKSLQLTSLFSFGL